MLITDDFRLKVLEIAEMIPWFFADVYKDRYTFNKYNMLS